MLSKAEEDAIAVECLRRKNRSSSSWSVSLAPERARRRDDVYCDVLFLADKRDCSFAAAAVVDVDRTVSSCKQTTQPQAC